MKYIGYWLQSLKDERYLPPQEFVGSYNEEERDRVIRYLSNGLLFEQYRGLSWCRFDCGVSPSEMGYREFTDGEWVWPEGLLHYIQKHNVKLPQEFINHTKKTINHNLDVNHLSDPQDNFWVQWCRDNRSGILKTKLNIAKENADLKYQKLREAYFKDVEEKIGISKINCITRKCENKSLLPKVFCAECSSSLEGVDLSKEVYFDILKIINR